MSERPATAGRDLAIEPWRRFALYILLLGIGGILLELLLLEHFEDKPQWVPLVLLVVGALLAGALLVRPSSTLVHAFRALMAAYVIASGAGIYFHLKANVEFELELRPSIERTELIVETLKGAMPALAPGAMAQLGLLGLLVSYRHPSLGARVTENDPA